MLKAAGNLMDATTTEDVSNVVNSVAIYDKNGNFLQRLGDTESQGLIGVMEAHITQRDGADAGERGQPSAGGREADTHRHDPNVLGDLSLITGETVVAREARTGLEGIFWIDADVHTWKNNNYYAKLTLNCRNVAATASAGSEIE